MKFLPLVISQMKWNGLRNGVLMGRAVHERFDVLVTIDKNLQYQQNLKSYNLSIVVFDTPSSTIESLLEFLPLFQKLIENIEKGKAYLLSI